MNFILQLCMYFSIVKMNLKLTLNERLKNNTIQKIFSCNVGTGNY